MDRNHDKWLFIMEKEFLQKAVEMHASLKITFNLSPYVEPSVMVHCFSISIEFFQYHKTQNIHEEKQKQNLNWKSVWVINADKPSLRSN